MKMYLVVKLSREVEKDRTGYSYIGAVSYEILRIVPTLLDARRCKATKTCADIRYLEVEVEDMGLDDSIADDITEAVESRESAAKRFEEIAGQDAKYIRGQ